MRIGIEIGGTFTDLVRIDGDTVHVAKVPSTPGRPDDGAFDALAAASIAPSSIGEFAHGSTVATNAVLERKGARLAFLVTEGFRDLLLLRRQDREAVFDIFYRKPAPLVSRADTLEVPERILGDGSVERALDGDGFAATLTAFIAARRPEAVAICLLNAFLNPAHERAIAAMLASAFPGLPVTCSVDVTREFREFERASTTTLSAYVQPVVDAYLGRIESRLAASGFTGTLSIMQSNGGRAPVAAMRRNAVTALLSGPAAGVTGAIRQAALSGFSDLVTLDIGGTSADVCLVQGGRPALTREARVSALPVLLPMVDITTIGAGGGSLVWMDEGGLLRVGPRSAGADPGPACYGRGGTAPTLTDAHVVCGRIRPDARLAGGLTLDTEAAHAAFAPLARRMGLTVEALADSAVQIAVANIVAAIRLVSTRRGRDPRDYALVPFGGAGPLHAAAVAEALAIETVLVPPNAGVISAYGLLAADYSLYDSMTRRTRLDDDAAGVVRDLIGGMLRGLETRAADLGLIGARTSDVVLDMRFVGQAFEIAVPLDPATLDDLTRDGLLASFAVEHENIYRHGALARQRPVEILSFRVGLHVKQGAVPSLAAIGGARPRIAETSCVVFDAGQHRAATRLGLADIAAGASRDGPLVLEDVTATIYVPAGWRATADTAGNLILRRHA